jgi:hypothetical protein
MTVVSNGNDKIDFKIQKATEKSCYIIAYMTLENSFREDSICKHDDYQTFEKTINSYLSNNNNGIYANRVISIGRLNDN